MSFTYTYERNSLSDHYDLENIVEEIDDITHIHPACDIQSAFPGNKFKLFGDDNKLLCIFDNELTSSEQTTLDTIIENSRLQS